MQRRPRQMCLGTVFWWGNFSAKVLSTVLSEEELCLTILWELFLWENYPSKELYLQTSAGAGHYVFP